MEAASSSTHQLQPQIKNQSELLSQVAATANTTSTTTTMDDNNSTMDDSNTETDDWKKKQMNATPISDNEYDRPQPLRTMDSATAQTTFKEETCVASSNETIECVRPPFQSDQEDDEEEEEGNDRPSNNDNENHEIDSQENDDNDSNKNNSNDNNNNNHNEPIQESVVEQQLLDIVQIAQEDQAQGELSASTAISIGHATNNNNNNNNDDDETNNQFELLDLDRMENGHPFLLDDDHNHNNNNDPQSSSSLCQMLCFPLVLLVSLVVILNVILFCLLPGILVTLIALFVYYCFNRDPIPFRVLLRALLLDDDNAANMQPRSREEILPHVVRRQCLGTTMTTENSEYYQVTKDDTHTLYFSDTIHHHTDLVPPTTTLHTESQPQQQQDDNDDSMFYCEICLAPYQIHETVVFSRNQTCSHYYHEPCILDWLAKNSTCPTCRADFLYENKSRRRRGRGL